ncbi:MAG: TyeA family type III secretion system gatekeeper subunit [Desulfovibrionaceae bacterium]|nr:TyeA family type III secretion system gatekeeper subunit [Desulfovibrionaceae bacterium]
MSQINGLHSHRHEYASRGFSDGPKAKIMGREVSEIRTAQTLLQEASEELSFTLDRSGDATLRKRSEKRSDLSRFDRAKMYYDMLAEEGEKTGTRKSKEALLDSFIESEPGSEAILREAMRHWPYPEEAWANLDAAHERAKQRGAQADLLSDIDEAIVLLEQRYGGAIQAGITGALVTDSKLEESPRERGNEYREAVFSCETVLDIYDRLKETHTANFSEAIDFLERAVALDMESVAPSRSREALISFAHNLNRLQLIRSADETLKPLETPSLPHGELLGRVLSLGNSPYPSAMDCDKIAKDAGKNELEERILYLQQLLRCVRSFPSRLFESDDGRVKLVGAAQDAVDAAVREEDALYA